MIEPYLKEKGEKDAPNVVPGDLPFLYAITERTVYCCVSRKWVAAENIRFAGETEGKEIERSVFYFEQSCEKAFADAPNKYTSRFSTARGSCDKLYFLPESD